MNETVPPLEPAVLLAESDFVRGLARTLLRDEAQVDDVTQQTYVAAIGHARPRIGSLRAWLASVVRRQSARIWRDEATRGRRERVAAQPDGAPSPVEVLAREETRRKVVAAVLGLDEPYRSVVLLRFYEDRPPRDIAHQLGLPVETVRTRLKRALEKLRGRLDRTYRGDRRAWAGALIPLAAIESGGGSMTALAQGGVAVSIKAKIGMGIAAVLALVAILGIGITKACETTSPTSSAADRERAPTEHSAGDLAETDAPPATPAPEPTEHVVSGTVVDRSGKPVARAEVYVMAAKNPFDEPADMRVHNLHGRTFLTDAAGAFRAVLPGPYRVHVMGKGTPHFRPDRESNCEVDTPATGIRIVGDRWPTGRLRIRVSDLSTGRALEGFGCAIQHELVAHLQIGTDTGVIETPIRLPTETGEGAVKITLIRPQQPERPFRTVLLRADETLEVMLYYRSAERILGVVGGPDGKPLAGAIVFFGNQTRARGDEPFKPFQKRRVPDAVVTGDDGRFELTGDGREVTFWHPEFSSRTVSIHEAGHVTLQARGGIRGRLLDAQERPMVGVEVVMDRTRRAKTGVDGRFRFDLVEAGVRGVVLPGKRYVAFRVSPGRVTEATIGVGIPKVRLMLEAGGRPFVSTSERGYGVLIGLDKVSSMVGAKLSSALDYLDVEGLMKGSYLFLAAGGLTARVKVEGDTVVVDLGAADLTVTGPKGTVVYVVPVEAADQFGQLMAGRIASKRISESGDVVFSPLPTGQYSVGVERGGVRATVDVKGPGASVTIR